MRDLLQGRPVGRCQRLHGAPRGVRDHPRDSVLPAHGLPASAEGVSGGRPVRRGGPDAEGEIRVAGRAIGLWTCWRYSAAFQCSYASVTLRLAEVVRSVPLMTVLYEREERGDPLGWTSSARAPDDGGATDVGFRAAGVPFHLRPPGRYAPAGEKHLTWLTGGAGRALRQSAVRAKEGDHAVVGRPVFWKGRLAKVAVVAVPGRFGDVLGPQLVASGLPCRRRQRPVKATNVVI